tara:strand:+ start:750 stop:1322 length:573 start_codon:yes stop_codon:yes gene_type:complete
MLKSGERIFYEVSFLEKNLPFHSASKDIDNSFAYKIKKPKAKHFFKLYNLVGYDYEWNDMYNVRNSEIEKMLKNLSIDFYLFFKNLKLLGFFILDFRKEKVCNLMYFGLLPDCIGLGYGNQMLKTALKKSSNKKFKKITVNTNTLDHPNALPLYRKMGFKVVKKEIHSRILVNSNNQKELSDLLERKKNV